MKNNNAEIKLFTILLAVMLLVKCGIVTKNGNVNSTPPLVSSGPMTGNPLHSTPYFKVREDEWADYLAQIHTPHNPIGGVFTHRAAPCLSIPLPNEKNR